MPKWPIRVKLIAGLSLVIGMMLTLMGGSMFGLHAFHLSNLVLTDQLRELVRLVRAAEVVGEDRRPARRDRFRAEAAPRAGGRGPRCTPGILRAAQGEQQPGQSARHPRRAGPGLPHRPRPDRDPQRPGPVHADHPDLAQHRELGPRASRAGRCSRATDQPGGASTI